MYPFTVANSDFNGNLHETSTYMQSARCEEENPNCEVEPAVLSKLYERNIHGYASLLICTIGAVSQLLNLIIFTRKNMITTTNVVLAGLAATDLMMVLITIPVTWYMAFQLDYLSNPKEIDYGWAIAVVCHSYFFLVLHTISVWLTMTLAIFRHIAVFHPLKYKFLCNIASVRRIIVTGCIACIAQRTPFLYAVFVMHPKDKILEEFHSCLNRNFPMGTNIALLILRMNKPELWLYYYNLIGCSVLSHLAPSAILVILIFRLLYALKKPKNHALYATIKMKETEKNSNRRTGMLLVVLFIFLLTEIPQGFLIIMAYIGEHCFYIRYYSQLGNVIDLLIVTSSSFNFVVYYLMDSRFRIIFKSWLGYKRKTVPNEDSRMEHISRFSFPPFKTRQSSRFHITQH